MPLPLGPLIVGGGAAAAVGALSSKPKAPGRAHFVPIDPADAAAFERSLAELDAERCARAAERK